MAIIKNDASITSDNWHIPVLVRSHFTQGKREDGYVYETGQEEHDGITGAEYISRLPVAKFPFGIEAFRNTHELRKLPFGGVLELHLQLVDALEQGDMKRVAGLREDLIEPDAELEYESLSAHDLLARDLNDALSGVRYVIWREKESRMLRSGILCKTLKQAAYAMLANSLGRPGGLGICKRCGALFQKRRTSQPYCSANCRVAEAMKRYRARKKREQRARGKVSTRRAKR